MKKIFFLLLFVSIIFSSCKKEKISYVLNFEANHFISEENMFTNPGAYFSWSVEDEDENSKFDRSESILSESVFGTTTAQTGDWIWIYISVYDVFCNGSVSCTSNDGTISLFTSTDNLNMNESDFTTARISKNGQDTSIVVIEQRFQIK
tara:strand:+ start:427 stop:873 length:447 start_codon:yes stop_codon:yes gene_type:complete